MKFWLGFNKVLFIVSLVFSFICDIILFVILSSNVGIGAAFLFFLVCGVIILVFHSLWGLMLEYISTVNNIDNNTNQLNICANEIASSIKEFVSATGKVNIEEKTVSKTVDKPIQRQPKIYNDKVCSYCQSPIESGMLVCPKCRKTIVSFKEKRTPDDLSIYKTNSSDKATIFNPNTSAQKPQDIRAQNSQEDSPWKCIKCGTINPADIEECRLCNFPKWSESKKWICTCGHLNNPYAVYCFMCGNHK